MRELKPEAAQPISNSYVRLVRYAQQLLERLPHIEAAVLVVWTIGTAATLGFIKLADEVSEGGTQHFDEWAVRALRTPHPRPLPPKPPDLPIGPEWLREVGRDLTGLGGIAHFERSLPRSSLARSVIYLAGPAVNWGLWQGLGWLAGGAAASGNPMLALPLAVLASANFFLMCFNLLPAYPLDGGHTLDAWLGAGADLVGARRRQPGPGRCRGRGLLRAAFGYLHAVRRLLPGAGQLGGAAERRRLVAAQVVRDGLGDAARACFGGCGPALDDLRGDGRCPAGWTH